MVPRQKTQEHPRYLLLAESKTSHYHVVQYKVEGAQENAEKFGMHEV